jgi:4-hydroxy-3-polyprenylbenzoate decarboxylase
MARATEAGAIVYPPVPAFYARPTSLEVMIDHTLGRVLSLFDIDANLAPEWPGTREAVGYRKALESEDD